MEVSRIQVTKEAINVIKQLEREYGELVFSLAGGCCDGARPLCLEKTDYYVKLRDILLGQVESFDFYVDKELAQYWQYSKLTLDVMSSSSDGFSLENDMGKAFVVRSELFTEEELKNILPLKLD